MAKRYDICTPRKGKDDRTFWTRIGTAWENDKGIQLVFDCLPLPDAEGRCVANLFEPKPKDSERGSGSVGNNSRNQSQNSGWGGDDNDDPNW